MRILLLGKFPPGQGGISAKTYWLYRALVRRGFEFDVITLIPSLYASDQQAEPLNGLRVKTLLTDPDGRPWFIPGGTLPTERLVAAALEMCESGKPDIVESNYLVPYGLAALVVSTLLNCPLLVRHAGSDIAKLLTWEPARAALDAVLFRANLVITNEDARVGLRPRVSRLLVLPRYAPDPSAFEAVRAPSANKVLLLAGKLNYHWRLKALDTLLAALDRSPGWTVLAVADGTGRQAFELAINEHGLGERVSLRAFIPPNQMPELLSSVSAVWAVERPGQFSDFSNVVWEAVARHCPCLVSASLLEHPDARLIRASPFLLRVKADDPASVASALDLAEHGIEPANVPDWVELHNEYVNQNAGAYLKVAGSDRH
jgi:glycosyltransferase involved in cell wall biosynthesis